MEVYFPFQLDPDLDDVTGVNAVFSGLETNAETTTIRLETVLGSTLRTRDQRGHTGLVT